MMDAYSNVTFTVETITPQIAQAYLSTSKGNRRISHTVVEKYAQMMRSGQWGESQDSIAFDKDGVLINGHQRLNAVILSGCSVKMAVTRGHNHEAMLTMDTGRARTAANAIEFLIPGAKDTRSVAAAARLILSYDDVSGFNTAKMDLVSNEDIAQFVEENQGKINTTIGGFLNNFRTLIAVFRFIAVKKHPNDEVEFFLKKLNNGENLSHGDPVLALRTAIINWQTNPRGYAASRNVSIFRLAYIFKAFNYWSAGKTFRLIKMLDGEAFPVIK